MAAAIGNLSLILSVSPAAMTAGLNKAGASLKTFATGVAGAAIGIASAFAGAASGIEDFLLGSGGLASQIDAQSKLADKLGVSTEALVGWTHAANLSGVSAEQLQNSLLYLEKTLGKAEAAGERSGASLAQFGLDAQKLATVPLEQSLLQISAAYKQLKTPAEKSALAVAAFGKSGQSIMTFLDAGPAGIASMAEEAKKLGSAFSREQGASVEAARDAWTRFQELKKGFTTQTLVRIAPFLTPLADGITKFGVMALDKFKELADRVSPIIQQIGNMIGPDLEGAATTAWAAIGTGIETALNVGKEVLPIILSYFSATWEVGKALVGALWEGAKAIFGMVASVVDFGSVWETIKIATLKFFIGIEFGAKNAQRIFSLFGSHMLFSFTYFWNEAKHILTVNLPQAFAYVGENAWPAFKWFFETTIQAFKNLFETAKDAGSKFIDWAKGGFSGDLNFGFDEALKNLGQNIKPPPIPPPKFDKRIVSEEERKWAADIMAGWNGVIGDLDAFTQKRLAELLGNVGGAAAQSAKAAGKAFDGVESKTQDKFANALLKGSSEAISAVNRYQFSLGSEGNLPARQLAEAQKANQINWESKETLKQIQKSLGVEVDL